MSKNKSTDFMTAVGIATKKMEETGKPHSVLGIKGDEPTIVRVVPSDEAADTIAASQDTLRVLFRSRSRYGDYVAACVDANETPFSGTDWRRAGRPKTPVKLVLVSQSRPAKQRKPGVEPRQKGAPKARPTRGTTKIVWDTADAMVAKGKGRQPKRDDVIKACVELGVNAATAATQYAAWKRSTQTEVTK